MYIRFVPRSEIPIFIQVLECFYFYFVSTRQYFVYDVIFIHPTFNIFHESPPVPVIPFTVREVLPKSLVTIKGVTVSSAVEGVCVTTKAVMSYEDTILKEKRFTNTTLGLIKTEIER